jgi:GNAT superfamily N-acetyltransferase
MTTGATFRRSSRETVRVRLEMQLADAAGYRSTVRQRTRVEPVTRDNWEAFAQLFEAKGGPHYCWCTAYRVRNAAELTGTEKRACMRKWVDADVPVGVLAFRGDEPVGWCSVAPRETYLRLEKSRTMPRATPAATSTWTILCFFVARPHRNQHVAEALLQGAVAYARRKGAEVVEGYPFDTARVSSTHRGHSRMFRSARFRIDGRRWFRRLKRSV